MSGYLAGMLRFVLTLCIATFSLAAPALAAPAVTGEFDVDGEPQGIAVGPDGNIWTPLAGSTSEFARITPDGQVTNLDVGGVSGGEGIVALGPHLWVTSPTELVRITPGAVPQFQTFTFNDIIQPQAIVVGPDGHLWTGSADKVLEFDVANPDAPALDPHTVGGGLRDIAAGTDGRLWVADFADKRVIAVNTDGTFTPHDVAGGGPQGIGAGPGGQVLYTNPNAANTEIGLLSLGGSPQKLPFGATDPFGVTFGQDGVYWVAQFNAGGKILRISTTGAVEEFTGLSAPSRQIARGQADTIWVGLEQAKKVGRISGVVPPAPTAVTLTGIKLSRSKFALAAKKTALAAAVKKGTTLSWTLSGAATTTIRVEKPTAGRRKGKSCVKPTRSNRRAKKCTRFVRVGRAITRIGLPGTNSLAFTGKYGSTKLKPGKYRFSLTAAPAGGSATQPQTKSFTIVKTKRR